MTKEKQPITTNSTVPFPSTAITADAARDDAGIAKEDAAFNDRPEPAPALDAHRTVDTPTPEPQDSAETATAGPPKMEARDISVFYGDKQALKDVSI